MNDYTKKYIIWCSVTDKYLYKDNCDGLGWTVRPWESKLFDDTDIRIMDVLFKQDFNKVGNAGYTISPMVDVAFMMISKSESLDNLFLVPIEPSYCEVEKLI